MSEIRHVVLTRFAVKVHSADGVRFDQIRPAPLSDGWLAQRFALFEQYCLPSMRAQTMADFVWRIYVHEGFALEHVARLRAYDPRIVVVTDPVTPVSWPGGILASTRIDSDDGFASNALEIVHRYARRFETERQSTQLLRLKQGWWLHHQRRTVYQYRGWSFLTLFERRAPYRGALVQSCDDIGKRYPEWTETKPLWLRVVHGNNVRNRFDPTKASVSLNSLQDHGFGWMLPASLSDVGTAVDMETAGIATDNRPAGAEANLPAAPDPDDSTLPRIALLMRTTDRRQAERPVRENYVKRTVTELVDQGVRGLRLHLSKPSDAGWIAKELGPELLAQVEVFTPTRVLSANANALEALGALDLDQYEWVLLLEDDLTFCRDFVPSVQRWLVKHAKSNRNVFRFFGFAHPSHRSVSAFDHSLSRLRASQAIALRREDARAFLAWGRANLATWRGSGPLAAKPGIAFDKFVAAWAQKTWPGRPGVLSWPFFVDHIGVQSSLHVTGGMNHAPFAGHRWAYEERV